MLHEPASECGPDHAAGYKMRLGVWMFLLYSLIYAGFVALNVYDAKIMAKIVFRGLNLATVYGFGLIVIALVLAMIYNHLCSSEEKRKANEAESGEGK